MYPIWKGFVHLVAGSGNILLFFKLYLNFNDEQTHSCLI